MYGIQVGDCEMLMNPKTKEGHFEKADLGPGGRLNCVLTTDHSGLHNNLVHMHRPPRHPGGVISTVPTELNANCGPEVVHDPAPCLRAVSPNCPGTQRDTSPVQPISAPEVSSLTLDLALTLDLGATL